MENIVGHAEQANVRIRRFGAKYMEYGATYYKSWSI
jgi:hypothetical protein